MAILKHKKREEAKADAQELASNYNIQYSDDGKTFTIHPKNDPTGSFGRTDKMVDSDRWITSLSRKKRLTTREYENIAEKQNLEAIKQKEKERQDLLKKLYSDSEEKTKQIEDLQNKYKDIEKTNKDLTTDLDKNRKNNNVVITKEKFPVITKERLDGSPESNIPIIHTEENKQEKILPEFIPNTEVYEKPNYPFQDLLGYFSNSVYKPSIEDFQKTNQMGKKFLVIMNNVYDVEDNLNNLKNNPINWEPVESKDYHRDHGYSSEIKYLNGPSLIKGPRPKSLIGTYWENVKKHNIPGYQTEVNPFEGRPSNNALEDLATVVVDGAILNEVLKGFGFLKKLNLLNKGSKSLKVLPKSVVDKISPKALKAMETVMKTAEESGSVVNKAGEITKTTKALNAAKELKALPPSRFQLPPFSSLMQRHGGKLVPKK